jgi:hypothetical protein
VRVGVEPTAGVVEVHVTATVKTREILAANLIENGCVHVSRML